MSYSIELYKTRHGKWKAAIVQSGDTERRETGSFFRSEEAMKEAAFFVSLLENLTPKTLPLELELTEYGKQLLGRD